MTKHLTHVHADAHPTPLIHTGNKETNNMLTPRSRLKCTHLCKVHVGVHFGGRVEIEYAQELGGHLGIVVLSRVPPQKRQLSHLVGAHGARVKAPREQETPCISICVCMLHYTAVLSSTGLHRWICHLSASMLHSRFVSDYHLKCPRQDKK